MAKLEKLAEIFTKDSHKHLKSCIPRSAFSFIHGQVATDLNDRLCQKKLNCREKLFSSG